MILYEVNLAVDDAIAARYAAWLETHIQELLALPGFEKAEWFERHAEEEGIQGKRLWTIHYRLTDRAALVHYVTHHAPRLRQEALDRFGDKFSATRRVLEPHRI